MILNDSRRVEGQEGVGTIKDLGLFCLILKGQEGVGTIKDLRLFCLILS